MPANIKPNKCSPLLSWDWLLPATETGLHSAMFWAAVFGGIGLAAQVVAGCLNGWHTQTGQLFAFAAAFPAAVFAEFFRAMLCGALRRFGKWPVGCAVTFALAAVECLPQRPGLPASPLAFCQDLLQIALPALAVPAAGAAAPAVAQSPGRKPLYHSISYLIITAALSHRLGYGLERGTCNGNWQRCPCSPPVGRYARVGAAMRIAYRLFCRAAAVFSHGHRHRQYGAGNLGRGYGRCRRLAAGSCRRGCHRLRA